jgi:hypothetical protein
MPDGRSPIGAIAQLGERLHGMQEVGGSIPPGSTTLSSPRGARRLPLRTHQNKMMPSVPRRVRCESAAPATFCRPPIPALQPPSPYLFAAAAVVVLSCQGANGDGVCGYYLCVRR